MKHIEKNSAFFNISHPKAFKSKNLFVMLLFLTLLFISWQLSLFIIHYEVSELIDTLANSSISQEIFHSAFFLPLLNFILIQLLAYFLFVVWIWYVAVSIGKLFRLSYTSTYWFGIVFWLFSCILLLLLNKYYFPSSFFSELLHSYKGMHRVFHIILIVVLPFLSIISLLVIFYSLFARYQLKIACLFLSLFILVGVVWIKDNFFQPHRHMMKQAKPNIILIGLDSVRPDYINARHTPHINEFMQASAKFSNAYTPLARTFPSWISVLTAKYPKYNHARANLTDPIPILANESLTNKLKENGYETIYGTDEVRFTDITKDYGFDRVISAKGGALEMLLVGLSDFPLTNLLIKLPIARFLFPYHYANRAADIIYDPNSFLTLLKVHLAERSNKPVFLAIHLCLAHWPFTWARDHQHRNLHISERYKFSVEALDTQFGKLLQLLKEKNLLDNSLVVLLSDHGVTIGLPDDRAITLDKYQGNKRNIKVSPYKLNHAAELTADFKNDYTISTSYGQGTDVLSLKQYHILLGFRGFGINIPAKEIKTLSSLLDIAPTILEFLKLPTFAQADGGSLLSVILNKRKNFKDRPFYIETGDSLDVLATKNILVNKIIKETVNAYRVDVNSGLLIINEEAEKAIIKTKQRAMLSGNWLLAFYPKQTGYHFVSIPHTKKLLFTPFLRKPYYVLLNLKTGKWTHDLNSPLAKSASIKKLKKQFNDFYGDEVSAKD